ncbi:MAG: dihydroorotase, partial [Pseudohongiellaceae bacterium]
MRATFLADVVLPERGDDEHVDVLIEDREIVSIATAGKLTAAKSALRIEGRGHWCLPGFIDDHVHLREPGLAHKEGYAAGTLAAAAGGVTTILEIQNNPPLMIDRQAVV